MIRIFFAAIALLGNFAWADRQSAFEAFRSVPAEEGLRLARIGASEGAPTPERWHFIVYDPSSENGLCDYVVADGRVVARNGVSQFAREAQPRDVLPYRSVRVDSDRVAAVVTRYADANDVEVISLNYELRKEPLDAQPVWKITAFDARGERVGWLMFDAGDGSVIARGGAFVQRPSLPSVNGEPLFDPTDDDRGVGGFHRQSSLESMPLDPETSAPLRRPVEVRRAEPVHPASRLRNIDPFRGVRDLLSL